MFCISCRRIVEWETYKKELEIQENEKLLHVWEEAKEAWQPDILFHPEKPLSFYVREKQHLTSDEMCEFVAQECDEK